MDTIDEYNIQVICVEKNGESISQHKDEWGCTVNVVS